MGNPIVNNPPPPDLPSGNPGGQGIGAGGGNVTVGIPQIGFTFDHTLPAANYCFFKTPELAVLLAFLTPSFSFTIPIPSFFLALILNCTASNPIDVAAGVGFGGGRTPSVPHDPDDDVLQ